MYDRQSHHQYHLKNDYLHNISLNVKLRISTAIDKEKHILLLYKSWQNRIAFQEMLQS